MFTSDPFAIAGRAIQSSRVMSRDAFRVGESHLSATRQASLGRLFDTFGPDTLTSFSTRRGDALQHLDHPAQ